MKRLSLALAVLAATVLPASAPRSASATPQQGDWIVYQGAECPTPATPLEAFLPQGEGRPAILAEGETTMANFRGYYGVWEIRDGKLYLLKVRQTVQTPGGDDPHSTVQRDAPLGEFFPAEKIVELEAAGEPGEIEGLVETEPRTNADGTPVKPAVHADWFTGELLIQQGELLQVRMGGHDLLYEQETRLTLENGVVTRTEVTDNTAGEMEEDQE